MKSNIWQNHLTQKAKKENYPARSVYKLEEIQKKFKLIKKKHKILELGASPGSWFLYCSKIIGAKGSIVGIDLKDLSLVKPPSNSIFYKRDVFDMGDIIEDEKFDIVLSDMAPNTTGNKSLDAFRSFDLCCKALEIAKKRLKKNGSFVCKIFQGEDFENFIKMMKATFAKHKIFKPQSCRQKSKEIYIIGLKKNDTIT